MSLDAEDIRDEKVKVLRSMKQVRLLCIPVDAEAYQGQSNDILTARMSMKDIVHEDTRN